MAARAAAARLVADVIANAAEAAIDSCKTAAEREVALVEVRRDAAAAALAGGSPLSAAELGVQLLQGGYTSSRAKRFLDLARASYEVAPTYNGRNWHLIDVVGAESLYNLRVVGKTMSDAERSSANPPPPDNTVAVEICFRGSVFTGVEGGFNLDNWCRVNMSAKLTALSTQIGDASLLDGVHVHAGFQDGYLAARPPVLRWLDAQREHPGQRLHVSCCGHSLGAALATLLALDLGSIGLDSVELVTWASPRVGNKAFCDAFAKLVPVARFTCGADMVTRMPPEVLGFFHVGPEVRLDAWVTTSKNSIVALASGTAALAASALATLASTAHSIDTYAVNLENCFRDPLAIVRTEGGWQLTASYSSVAHAGIHLLTGVDVLQKVAGWIFANDRVNEQVCKQLVQLQLQLKSLQDSVESISSSLLRALGEQDVTYEIRQLKGEINMLMDNAQIPDEILTFERLRASQHRLRDLGKEIWSAGDARSKHGPQMLDLLIASYSAELELLRASRPQQIQARHEQIDRSLRSIFLAIEATIRSGSFSREECPALDCLLPQLLIGARMSIPSALEETAAVLEETAERRETAARDSQFVDGNRASRSPADNALRALSKFGPLDWPDSPDPATFAERVGQVLEWYAYSLAGEARQQDEEGQRQTIAGLPALHARILNVCSDAEPCTAVWVERGKKYPCTQLRCGHSCEHRNPAMLSRPKFGLWQDKRPCVWSEPEGFQAHTPPASHSLGEFERLFALFLTMPAGSYQLMFRPACEWNTTGWVEKVRFVASSTESGDEDLCMLCLRRSSDMVVLPHAACRHFLCRQCVVTRKALSSDAWRYESTGEINAAPPADVVDCPFCHNTSTLKSTPSDDNGFRILSLDGGGVRGLIEVLVLKELEKVFHPLPISSLFDLIMGTSAGGIVSMALHARVRLENIEAFLANEAACILDTSSAKAAFRSFTGQSVCDSRVFKNALIRLFGYVGVGPVSGPPFFMCTAYCKETNETEVFGSFPSSLQGRSHLWPSTCWQAAYTTAAAPIYFDAEEWVLGGNHLVDGGIRANCPAKLAVKFATEFQLDSRAESSSFVEMIASLGTGLEKPQLTAPHANGLTWAKMLISFALDSEQLWRDGILDNDALRDVPKVRVNPPDLGSLDPFVSASIPKLRSGMKDYFESEAGKLTMGRLIHLVHAKLWHVRLQTNLVAGAATEMHIEMREHRLDFSTMSRPACRKIIKDRRECVSSTEVKELRNEAEAAFSEQPFDPPLQGHFVISFSGTEQELPGREFAISSAEPGTPQLHVWWRSDFGDFPISGFPRSIRVIGEEQASQYAHEECERAVDFAEDAHASGTLCLSAT